MVYMPKQFNNLYFIITVNPVSYMSACPTGTAPIAGNSIGADKRFLDAFMPQFMSHLHYRVVDVSTVKELCR